MVNLARLEDNKISLNMPLVCHKRPAIWTLTTILELVFSPRPVCYARLARYLAPTPNLIPTLELTNMLCKQMIERCIELAQNHLTSL